MVWWVLGSLAALAGEPTAADLEVTEDALADDRGAGFIFGLEHGGRGSSGVVWEGALRNTRLSVGLDVRIAEGWRVALTGAITGPATPFDDMVAGDPSKPTSDVQIVQVERSNLGLRLERVLAGGQLVVASDTPRRLQLRAHLGGRLLWMDQALVMDNVQRTEASPEMNPEFVVLDVYDETWRPAAEGGLVSLIDLQDHLALSLDLTGRAAVVRERWPYGPDDVPVSLRIVPSLLGRVALRIQM